ncbi:MAG: gamma-glutamyltransferase family protein [Acidobacteria bacterium]|nr:gamma-glutamyltransferase family protein [Acidobacteriota bacterium]MCW5968736.1 gamma-glutamyltransferase family protein [Blastocatellales bacterium]
MKARPRVVCALLCALVISTVLPHFAQNSQRPDTFRPAVRGRRAVVAGGHPLSVEAGMRMLYRGGNAVDAGVAAVLAASVIEFSHFGFGGEVPVLIKPAGKPVVVVNGQGQAPKLATREFFERRLAEMGASVNARNGNSSGPIPTTGPLAATAPGVLDAMILALDRYGTMRLADVLQPAIELADGFPIDELRVRYIENTRRVFEVWPDARDIFLPGGEVPRVGDVFVQKNLANTLRELVAAEKRNARRGRRAALEAARDYFYRGPLAVRYCKAIEEAGGLMRPEDMAAFRAEIDEPVRAAFHGYDVYKVGFWSQGPVMLQTLNILESDDLKKLGHNSAAYVHTLTEAFKLGFADRDRYYGDPRFVAVPAAELLSKDYARMRRALIDAERASLEQRPGDPVRRRPIASAFGETLLGPSRVPEAERANDTTCVNVIDAEGNVFSATPSGAWLPAFVAGDTGIPISSRLQSFLLEPGHPNELKPGKRPRITLTPTLVMKDGAPFAALSTPGGDNQDQALLQVLLNVIEFGMNPQEAVEAARFDSLHLVSSFDDHRFQPGSLQIEARFGPDVIEELRRRGHRVEVRPDFNPSAAPTIVIYDPKTRVIQAGADVRRGRYAIGW